ncbi:hypothetical protein Nisw_04320 [Candidatus Nitrosopumilus sp. SW]|uniref:PEP-utilizing enzyme n=1 Tax=Candidatus Nitrosopumilus sp. SW TaxID=2508726 RepID=UPI00114EFA06|nr:PEP-utilizing enzyme [Candidatus Nitrosopumilus sp. SW]QDI88801.1 hypothetical protein Nisw_04320 [Candidatus Nitrosopumilus sp. SW]
MNKTSPLFTTKVNTLKFLQNKLSKSRIEPFVDFTISDWTNNQNKLLDYISTKFKNKKIIIRSSAEGEDSFEKSEAGSFLSILDVFPTDKNNVKNAINSVIRSYLEKNNSKETNQIFAQKQTTNIKLSGVIFTKTGNKGSPYYLINYDLGSSTTSVTSGKHTKSIAIFRKKPLNSLPKTWKNLLTAIKEIETITKSSQLDIEFGIDKNDKIIIFQVRPITFIEKTSIPNIERLVGKAILKCKKQFSTMKFSKNIAGKKMIFSDMADWNPSEIIGPNPNLLDYSLYDYLIMKKSWHQGRKLLGYQDVNPCPLMKKFGNKPYVDIQASFNSLIPDNIPKKLRKKLMNFYISKLQLHPELHDKVEFEILFTCYDFSLSKRLSELKNSKFEQKEIEQIKNKLIDFTNDIIINFSKIKKKAELDYSTMIQNRTEILKTVNNSKDYGKLLDAAVRLLRDCRLYGTAHFSSIARTAFIASILLKSLVKNGSISSSEYEIFLESIQSPLTNLRKDFSLYSREKISLKQLMEKYGHLRSGTYDITAPRYDENPELISNFHFIKYPNSNKKFIEPKLSKTFSKHGLKFNPSEFFSFAKSSISMREHIKFEFTRNLSDALELIAKSGQILGFSREDISNLNFESILSYKKLTKRELEKKWKEKILIQKNNKTITDFIQLPPIINSDENFEMFSYFASKPNFITRKKITSNIIVLDKKISSYDVSKKIVVIENADPGFDWIFMNDITGLITKYGGVASHMAIRCAELGIPAAIGCGEILYETLLESSKIILDCDQKQIIIIKTKNNNEFLEEKKVLKSLGYIK